MEDVGANSEISTFFWLGHTNCLIYDKVPAPLFTVCSMEGMFSKKGVLVRSFRILSLACFPKTDMTPRFFRKAQTVEEKETIRST